MVKKKKSGARKKPVIKKQVKETKVPEATLEEIPEAEPEKKPEKKGKETASNMDILIKDFERKFGKYSIIRASDFEDPFVVRRPTGILGLDLALCGGIPASGLSELYGPESTGKTYLAFRIAREIQRIYADEAKICYASFGNPIDKSLLHFTGVKVAFTKDETEKFEQSCGHLLTTEEKIRMRLNIGEFLILSNDDGQGERTLDMIIAMIASGYFHLVIIDEVGIHATEWRMKQDLTKGGKAGDSAFLMNQFMRKYHGFMNRRVEGKIKMTSTLVCTQVRTKIDMFGQASSNPGSEIPTGRGMQHGKLIDLHLFQGKQLKVSETDKESYGKMVHWRIAKAKTGVKEGSKGSYIHLKDRGADIWDDALQIGLKLGLVKLNGAYYKILDSTKSYQGQERAKLSLMLDTELMNTLRKEAFRVSGVVMREKE